MSFISESRPQRRARKSRDVDKYLSLRKAEPWFIRAYLAVTDFLQIDPDTLDSVKVPCNAVCIEGAVVAKAYLPTAAAPRVVCSNPLGCFCKSKGGRRACKEIARWAISLLPIGATLTPGFFSGSPQQHAIMNRHLVDYFNARNRALESTPYNVPASQRFLLAGLGMELPQPDAPEAPHALHKSIEEFQLRRLRRLLPANNYGIISVKTSKLGLLPPAASVQNPVFEAKDITRYPGAAVAHAHFRDHNLYLMHDVSSEVHPHELVEKLVAENPEAQLIVTGMNPAEVLDGCNSWEPASHSIEYDNGNFNFIFTDSESESYFTPISVTKSWLRSSSVCASNGRVYHVTLIEYKLGHCVWHIYCGEGADQHTRTFSTGSMVRLPSVVTGTLGEEYLPAKLLSGVLDFTQRTPDPSARNLAAKVTQVANAVNPKTTARERWIAVHVAEQLASHSDWKHKTWFWWGKRLFWDVMYIISLQWQMLKPMPDLWNYVDERKRNRTIHPTPGGGWSQSVKSTYVRKAIPNNPTFLHQLSAWSGTAFTFVLPKILIGEWITLLFWHFPLFDVVQTLWKWMEFDTLRFVLTASIIVVTSILPGHIVKVFSRLAGHFYRQLWWPGWTKTLIERLITEVVGAPGYSFIPSLPGRGWLWQIYIWAVGAYSFLPGLPIMFIFPWYAWSNPITFSLLMLFYCLIILENLAGLLTKPLFVTLPYSNDRGDLINIWMIVVNYLVSFVALGFQRNLGNCQRLANLPPLPLSPPPAVRRLNVNIQLPSVVVMPAAIPQGAAPIALAVDPTGMNFADWLLAVTTAYQQNPNQYPALVPGRSCFWDCVAHYGGTPHMWYSWYMAFMRRLANANDVHGEMTLPQIQVFAGISRFGISITGLAPTVVQAQGQDWPTMHLHLDRSPINGILHIELAAQHQPNTAVSNLARILRWVLNSHPAWHQAFQNAYNNAAPTSVPRATAILNTFAGTNDLPTTMQQVSDALVASMFALPVDPNVPEGFAIDAAIVYQAPFPPLMTFDRNMGTQPIGSTSPARMWQRFKSISKNFRLPAWHPHPLANPDMKIGATPSQNRDNRTRNNARPEPPRHVQLRNELAEQLLDYQNLALPDVPLQEELLLYRADVSRAARLAADLKAHPSVLETRSDLVVIQSLDSVIDIAKLEGKTVSMPIRAYLGVMGCGKTTATIAYLKTLAPEQLRQVRIVSHTESLRAQAKYKIDFPELRGANFPTIGGLIAEPSTGPIVIDDAGKYWGGILDLVILTNPLVPEIVVNGDPAQGLSKFPVRGTQSEHDPSAIEAIAKIACLYATRSHRSFQLLSNTLGIHTTNPLQGHITHTVSPKHGIPVCTASPRYVGVLAGAGRQAYTYESVQGEDFQTDVEIDLTGLEGAISDRTAYVALSRSTTGVYLHMDAADPTNTLKSPPSGSDLVNALVYAMRMSNGPSLSGPDWVVKASFYRHLHWCMPLLPWFARIGASLPAADFQMIAPMSTDQRPLEHDVVDIIPIDALEQSTGPHDNLTPETHFIAKEYRELNTSRGQTDQFKETSFVNPHVHKRSDTPTYFESVAQRLTHATKEDNLRRMQACPRLDLIEEYKKLVPNPTLWTAENFDGYLDRSIEEYMSKRTASDVTKKLESHDPDRSGSDIKISLKNQVIKKDEKRHKVSAIPGQLIHEYDVLTTLSDAAYALWFEDHVIGGFPEQFLFYRRMSPASFTAAYKKRWRVGNGVHTSDVTRWDVGCDAGLLNLDIFFFSWHGFPKSFIDRYTERRLTSRSQHGPMATMQNSGDRFTWPINSVRRAVVASYVLQLQPEDTCAINGDDEATDRCIEAIPLLDTPWVFKDQNGDTGEFSGFTLGGPEPEYSAEGVYYRSLILEDRDPSAQDKWTNYLDLINMADRNSTEAVLVAHSAHRHMKPELFKQFLPPQFHSLFPTVFSFES